MPSLTKVLVASDLHGSNRCFRKLLGLVSETRPDMVALAGDFSGKTLIPISRQRDETFTYVDADGRHHVRSREEMAALRSEWGDHGLYSVEVDEIPPNVEARRLWTAACAVRLKQWFDYGAKSFPGLPVCVIPGNDDAAAIVEVMSSHPWVKNVDCNVQIVGEYEVFGLGYSNLTPWATDRELPEDEIALRLTALGQQVGDMERAVAIVHIPPFDSGLDSVPALRVLSDGSLRPTGSRVPRGSPKVREFLAEFRPLLLICGHCHSASGIAEIYGTMCVNPGSAFQRGVLLARLVVLDGDRVVDHQRLVR